MQPARRGRGGRGGRCGLLLQLAHPEGAPAPGDVACGPVAHSDPVSMGSESAQAMLRARRGPLVQGVANINFRYERIFEYIYIPKTIRTNIRIYSY